MIRNRKSVNIWQERSVACTLLLHNEEEKLRCAVQILKAAPVPWSKSLDPILKLRSSGHPLAGDIEMEYQNQKIRIMRLKYGWKPDTNYSTNDMKFIYRMLKVNPPDLISDIREYVEVAQSIKTSAYFYCAHQLAKSGYVEKSIKFIDSLNEKDSRECCDQILKITPKLIEEEIDSPETFRDLMELMKYVIVKDVNRQEKGVFDDLMHLQILRKQFNLKIKMADLTRMGNKKVFLVQGIDSLMEQLRSCHEGFVQKAWSCILLLAKTLRLDVVVVVMELIKRINNVRFTCAMSKLILDFAVVNESNYNCYIYLAVLLIAQQCIALDGINSDNYIVPMSYPLAYRLLIEAQKSTDENIRDLLNWSRIGNDAYSLDRIYNYLDGTGDLDENVSTYFFLFQLKFYESCS